MNTVVNRTAGSAVAALQSLSKGLSNVVATIPTSSGDPYLRMQTDGSWVYGQENVEVEAGSHWAVNIFSFKHGYSSWTDHPKDARGKQPKNEKVGEVMVGMQEPKPLKTSLEDTNWDWRDQVSVQLKCVNGEDKGEQVLYNTTALGGLNALAKLIDAVQKQLVDDIDHPMPVLELLSDHYPHKTYGKTYFPVFEIVDWVTLEGEGGGEAGEIEDVKDAVVEPVKPARTRKASVPATGKAAEGPKATEELAQAIETPRERALRLLAEAEAEEAAANAAIAAPAGAGLQAPADTGGTEIRRRRRSA